MNKILGIIGGSGLYDISGVDIIESHSLDTPWGAPSAPVVECEYKEQSFFFLPRHGIGHSIPPSKINYRANIEALKKLGTENIISLSAVGSLRNDYIPGDFVLVDQFIDKTYLRDKTFFEDDLVVHLPMAQPICKNIKSKLADSLAKLKIKFHNQGTYICIEGPQFSTLAESELFRSWGCDVIGMTNMPEAKLSLEAGICYASVGMVTDFDCWHPDHENVSVDQIVKTLNDNSEKAKKLIFSVAKDEKLICNKKIKNLSKNSIITNIEKVKKSTKRKLKNILK